jgi:hypothetical protein
MFAEALFNYEDTMSSRSVIFLCRPLLVVPSGDKRRLWERNPRSSGLSIRCGDYVQIRGTFVLYSSKVWKSSPNASGDQLVAREQCWLRSSRLLIRLELKPGVSKTVT